MDFYIANFISMGLYNTSLRNGFPYQNMEFHSTKILKESIATEWIFSDLFSQTYSWEWLADQICPNQRFCDAGQIMLHMASQCYFGKMYRMTIGQDGKSSIHLSLKLLWYVSFSISPSTHNKYLKYYYFLPFPLLNHCKVPLNAPGMQDISFEQQTFLLNKMKVWAIQRDPKETH